MKTHTRNKTIDLGNNETIKVGIVSHDDGTFTALTRSRSRTFKTELGATRWLARIGFTEHLPKRGEAVDPRTFPTDFKGNLHDFKGTLWLERR